MSDEVLIALLSAATEAIFSYALEQGQIGDRVREWVKRDPAKLAYQKALACTYSAFARQYPELTASLFDQSFLTREAVPELSKLLTRHEHPDPAHLATLWITSFVPKTDAGQASMAKWSKDVRIVRASAHFLHWLESELKAEPVFQPLFDSRAFESLPAIEAKLDQLATALQQAVETASHYQQTVVNRSGGIDLSASNLNIDGDVVGRDKIVSNVYHNYFYGGFETLDDLYVRPDAVFQRVRIQDFIGREWLTAKVDAFLDDPQRKSGVFLLVGEAGVGKTSFLAHLVAERRYLHLFAEQVPGDGNVSRALQSLGAQLVARFQIDPYKEKGTLPAIATFPDFLDKLLRLAAGKLSAGEKIVVVCDALDEAGTAPNGNVFGLPSMLPDGVYFILSQRPVTVKVSVKADLVRETIDATGADNLHDVEQYLTAVSHRAEVSNQLRAHHYTEGDFVRILKERSGGVWMYLFYVVSEIATGAHAPLDLTKLPSGLAGYYTDYWGDWCEGRRGRGDGPAKWDAMYAPLLATLAAAQSPISLKLLVAWSRVQATEYEVERLLRRNWRAFIIDRDIERTPNFSLYHASLRDFLTGKVDRQGLTLEADQLVNELARRTCDAHTHIVEYYRKQCDGDWVRLVEDDYSRVYLCFHLSASGDNETMYQLVAMGNAWVEANYAKEGGYTNYLTDLNRAWQWVESEQGWNTGRQIRCALIESSLHSIASGIWPQLLVLLIDTQIWSPARALALIPLSDESTRSESLREIAPYLPDILKVEALAIARTIREDHNRVEALSGLAPYLSDDLKDEIVREALTTARTISDDYNRAHALSSLVLHLVDALKAEVVREALAAAHAITHHYYRARALSSLMPHLPDDSKAEAVGEALADARAINHNGIQVEILSGLAPHLPDDLKAEALTIARAISEDHYRAPALSGVVPYLSDDLKAEVVREALASARAITSDESRVRTFSGLAPYLSDDLKAEVVREALASARAINKDHLSSRAYALSWLVPHLSDDLKSEVVREALAAARTTNSAYALSDLAPYLSDDLKAEVVREALTSARIISDDALLGDRLSELAPHLPDNLMAEAFAIVPTIHHGYSCARALSGLAPHLTDNLKVEALAIARAISEDGKIRDEYHRANALSGLVPYLPDDLKAKVVIEALNIARTISEDYFRIEVLSRLVPHLPDRSKAEVIREALTAARALTNDESRVNALLGLVPYLSHDLKAGVIDEALSTANTITNDYYGRARTFFSLSSHLSDDLKEGAVREAVVAANNTGNDLMRADVLADLAPILPHDLKAEVVREALAAVHIIDDSKFDSAASSDPTPHQPEDLKLRAIVEAYMLNQHSPFPTLPEVHGQIVIFWRDMHFTGFSVPSWREALHSFARQRRQELLRDLTALIPLIKHLGGDETIREFLHAVRDVRRWWP